jgi:D-glycero-D-manno-heptose 1,7-bisphosphate phosphatase
MKPSVVFLDRDGVINRDSETYVKNWSEFSFLPNSLEALRRLNENHCRCVVVTNQSAIGRGIATRADVEEIHRKMSEKVAEAGGWIEDILYCPHVPADGCRCRKPEPGLVLRACRRLGIEPAASAMVGDSARDIECALRAGCGAAVLVRTGNGVGAEGKLRQRGLTPGHVAEDLLEAALWMAGSR